MKTREIKDLLMLLRDRLENCDVNMTGGICAEIYELLFAEDINIFEKMILYDYIHKNKPSKDKHLEFTQNECWIGGCYWWTPIYLNTVTLQIRINFINKLISEL